MTLATLSGLEVGTTSTCSLNATTTLVLSCASLVFSTHPTVYFPVMVFFLQPQFHNLLCSTTLLKRTKRSNFLAYIVSAATAERSMDYLFLYLFFCLIFNNYIER